MAVFQVNMVSLLPTKCSISSSLSRASSQDRPNLYTPIFLKQAGGAAVPPPTYIKCHDYSPRGFETEVFTGQVPFLYKVKSIKASPTNTVMKLIT